VERGAARRETVCGGAIGRPAVSEGTCFRCTNTLVHLARSVNETPEEMHNEKPDVERLRGRRCDADVTAGLSVKIGWAFAWRTLIAAELVFGVSSGQGGLGWFIFENRNLLDIPAVFAGLLTVIVIGLIVENLIFRTIERNTVQKWGTQS
jgi:hypothetical protein